MAETRIRYELKPEQPVLDETVWQNEAVLLPAAHLSSVSQVITQQEKVRRCYSAAHDGIFWFNHFYISVTRGVQEEIGEREFGKIGDDFLRTLDIEFYGFYRNALCEGDAADPVRVAWAPLFDHRGDRIDPILFALSGMNAHILCDLPQAIMSTLTRLGRSEFPADNSEEHAAFEDLNEILYRVAVRCLKADFTSGVLGLVYRAFIPYLARVGDGYIRTVRDLAWVQAHRLWNVREQPECAQEMRMALASSARSFNEWILTDVRFPPKLGLADVAAWVWSHIQPSKPGPTIERAPTPQSASRSQTNAIARGAASPNQLGRRR
jgi:uncharacterized protein DUF5995